MDVNYEDLRELFILDPRINPSHTFVYRKHPYYESHCLDKDVPAITEYMKAVHCDISFLENVIEYNNKRKIRKDDINGNKH